METKHTPGPWEAIGLDIRNQDDTNIVSLKYEENNTDEVEANARLMAAAPDLLEALQIWIRFFDEMPEGQFGNICCDIGLMNDGFIQSRRAIAKATGE